ncbi:MAG: acyl-CoA/acyl-ACP dehydrogenase [Slackia piriformis]|uniref:Acyl-CoA/acyl-ACP dehydrogenase n=1 Tax=Slackia piriformis TaxID=626934 RepID=A0A943UXR6_9ACTN|nr:acyl-CoA/acyl-ACP dehydrogenase [Slackia piriformis]
MSKLTEEQFEAYLKQIRELVEGPLEEMQPEIEVTNKFPQEFYDLAIKNDLYRFALPSQYGGWDLSELDILRVQEEFSRGPGGMRMHLHYAADLNWRILDDYGCDELKAEYMPKFQDKSIFTNFALTERTGGTGADVHTTAVKDAEGNYILNGEKWLISHTDCSQFSYVIAVTDPEKQGDERLSAFFVPMDKPGFELIPMPHMMGCRGAGHAGLRFTDVKLEPKYLLGKEGQGMEIAMHSLAVSRVHIADSNLGMAQRMLEMAIARSNDRITFGKPIASRQAIKMKIANMAAYIHALRCMVIDFAEDYDVDPHGPMINEKAAMCKLVSIDTVRMVSDEMLEIFGGDGYFEDSPYGPTERLYRDARALFLEEGSPTIQRITIARDVYKRDGYLEYQDWIAGGNLD